MDIANFWKTIVDTLREGLIVVDASGTILAANAAAEQLTGYTTEELLGRSCQILNCTGCKILGEEQGKGFCNLFVRGNIQNKKCLITNKDGHTVNIIKSAVVLKAEDGIVIGAVETLTDISDNIRQENEIESLRKTCNLNEGYHGLIGRSVPMQRLFELIGSVSESNAPVMIQGQSGTGKGLVARAIHDAGQRRNNPFIQVNCTVLNENLLESELFGHVKGAYTGADRTRIGRFEAAHEGTIFLDEIGDIPLSTQIKLLRVLEESKIERVGDHRTIPIDVRIITATNKNLEKLVSAGIFREDLFFRINVFPIHCPKLVERRDDIPLIVANFIRQNALSSGKKITGVSPDVMELLMDHPWTGNVRELRNTIEYAFVLCPGGWIDRKHLPPKLTGKRDSVSVNLGMNSENYREREKLIQALRESGGSRTETAKLLGVSRVTVWKRIKKYGISDPEYLTD